jgi:hypothetical protein
MLDPIADKLLIASVLLLVTYAGQIAGCTSGPRHHPVPRNTGFGLARVLAELR